MCFVVMFLIIYLNLTLQTYGFYGECRRKYGSPNVWRYFTDLFDYLTIAALIDNKIYAVHGGLSPVIITIDQIRTIDRFQVFQCAFPFCNVNLNYSKYTSHHTIYMYFFSCWVNKKN